MGAGSSSAKASSSHTVDFYSGSDGNDTFEKRMGRLETRFAAAAAKRAALLENAIRNTIQLSVNDSKFNAQEAQKLLESFTRAVDGYTRDPDDGRNMALMHEYSVASKRYIQEARAIVQQIQEENAAQIGGQQEEIRNITALLSRVEDGLKKGEERAKKAERNAAARKRGVRIMHTIEEMNEENNPIGQGGGTRTPTRRRLRRKRSQTRRK